MTTSPYTLNCNGKLIVLSRPVVMGILNLSPDSFYDGGKYHGEKEILVQVEKMISEGASILDIGGQSSRPGAKRITVEEELKRVVEPVRLILNKFPDIILSVDTFYSKVAKETVEAGAGIINDISAGSMDEKMFDTVAALKVPYVLMHMRGDPSNMQKDPQYYNVFEEVNSFFKQKIYELNAKGIYDIIPDPGFGFGKTTEHNFTLLKRLKDLQWLGKPILAGLSRKSMINKVLGTKPEKALNGTTVLNTIALMNGVCLLRVHDVREAKEAIRLTSYYQD